MADQSAPTAKQVIAEILARFVDKPGHNMVASEVVKKLAAAGYAIVPKEPNDEMVDAALRSTAVHLDIPGSQLTVNREKMRVRWRAMLGVATSV